MSALCLPLEWSSVKPACELWASLGIACLWWKEVAPLMGVRFWIHSTGCNWFPNCLLLRVGWPPRLRFPSGWDWPCWYSVASGPAPQHAPRLQVAIPAGAKDVHACENRVVELGVAGKDGMLWQFHRVDRAWLARASSALIDAISRMTPLCCHVQFRRTILGCTLPTGTV